VLATTLPLETHFYIYISSCKPLLFSSPELALLELNTTHMKIFYL
ncbi:unnamed protein product, partial [Arabidopsis halleri]